jgi:alpha-glucosidase
MISENASILTQGHTLAQAVVFTSAMVNYADSAAAYEQWDGRQLMRVLPTTWDETKSAANTRGGGANVQACKGCSGGNGVSGLAAGSLSVPFQAASSGNKTVRIHYASATAASIKVTVNGGTPVTVPLHATGDGDVPATATVGLPLSSGVNTILIKNASGATVTVDSLDVVM